MIRPRHGVALGDLERFAVVIAGAIEPALIVESAGLDDERAVPLPDRLPHPRIDLRRTGILQIDVPDGASIFVGDDERLVALKDLKRKRHVCRAWNTRQIALDLGIARQPVVLILFLREAFRRCMGPPTTTPTPAGTEPTAPNATTSWRARGSPARRIAMAGRARCARCRSWPY